MIYVDAEAVPQILEQRATAWGMDPSRLYLMLPGKPYGLIDLGEQSQQDRLARMVHQLEPDLVVVDSLSSITMKGENQVEDVREVLRFLAALADECDVAVLLIHHLRKRGKAWPRPFDAGGPGGLVTADEFRGSSHIITMARSVLALSVVQVGPEPDRNGPRRLEVVKTNLCRYPPALGVVFEDGDPSHSLGTGAGSGVPRVRYVEVPKWYRQPTQADACAKWLVELLAEAAEPLRPKEVVALAREAGFTRGVVYRAREQARERVVDTEGRRHPDNRWALAPEGAQGPTQGG